MSPHRYGGSTWSPAIRTPGAAPVTRGRVPAVPGGNVGAVASNRTWLVHHAGIRRSRATAPRSSARMRSVAVAASGAVQA